MEQPISVEAASLLHIPLPPMPQGALAQTGAGISGDLSTLNPSGGTGTSNQDTQAAKEEGEQTPEQQSGQSNDAMNSMMQMGFPMNPEQMQQQMMMMQQQMMAGGNLLNNAAETDGNNAQAGASGNADEGNQAQPDMDAMMAAMGGMSGMDMQNMMNMFGMGMPGMGNMNGMPDMSGFNMAQMAQGEYTS